MQTPVVSAYVIGVIVAILMLFLAVIISRAIAFEPGAHPKDPKKRKTVFWLLGVLTPILTFLLCFLFVFMGIKMKTAQDKYMTAMCISTGISFVLYIGVGLFLSKIFKHSKISNWF